MLSGSLLQELEAGPISGGGLELDEATPGLLDGLGNHRLPTWSRESCNLAELHDAIRFSLGKCAVPTEQNDPVDGHIRQKTLHRRGGDYNLVKGIGELVATAVGHLGPHVHVLRRENGTGVAPHGYDQHVARRQHQMLDKHVTIHAVGNDDIADRGSAEPLDGPGQTKLIEEIPNRFAEDENHQQQNHRNGDGDLTLKEFLGEAEEFKKLDTNDDGFIEPKEAKAATANKK